jgi:hypothetical protein
MIRSWNHHTATATDEKKKRDPTGAQETVSWNHRNMSDAPPEVHTFILYSVRGLVRGLVIPAHALVVSEAPALVCWP